MNLQIKFDFHNVGQGLFHTGKIGYFNFVYDCGSMKKDNVHEAVKKYKINDLKDKVIDVLVISHFDKDHINGLERLLKNVKVEYAIIPYYSPFEKLALAFVNRSYPEPYFDFLLDPASYLLSRGVNTVLRITENKYKSIANDSFDIYNQKDRDIEEYTDDRLIDIIDKEDINQILKDAYKGKRKNIFDYWEFKFFYHKISSTKLNALIKCFDGNYIHFSNGRELQNYVRDSYSRDKIKKCYKESVNSDLNFTSLAMYHGPIGPYKIKKYTTAYSNETLSGMFSISQQNEHEKIGHLLTGDINLKTKHKYAEFKKSFCNEWNKVTLFQVPHHGSSNNWNKHILFDLKKCNDYIVSAGISSRYGHPHPTVISEILAQQKNIGWCHEFNRISIEGEVSYTANTP